MLRLKMVWRLQADGGSSGLLLITQLAVRFLACLIAGLSCTASSIISGPPDLSFMDKMQFGNGLILLPFRRVKINSPV